MSNDFNGLIIKAARTLLNWGQQELADKAGCSVMTVVAFEKENSLHLDATRARIVNVMEEAGITFVPYKDGVGPGVLYSSREARKAVAPAKPRTAPKRSGSAEN
jgi:transcriptional regulator with XRE-family HTH domain